MIVKEMTVLLLSGYWELTYRYSNLTMTNFQREIFTSELYPRFNSNIEAALFNDDNLDKHKKVEMESVSNLLLHQTPPHEKEAGGKERNVEWRREGAKRDREASVFNLHLSFLLVPAATSVH